MDLDLHTRNCENPITSVIGYWSLYGNDWYFIDANGQYVTGWQFITETGIILCEIQLHNRLAICKTVIGTTWMQVEL